MYVRFFFCWDTLTRRLLYLDLAAFASFKLNRYTGVKIFFFVRFGGTKRKKEKKKLGEKKRENDAGCAVLRGVVVPFVPAIQRFWEEDKDDE